MPRIDNTTLKRLLEKINTKGRNRNVGLKSRCVEEYDYSLEGNELTVKFLGMDDLGNRKGDGTYVYTGVPLDVFVDFAGAESQGTYFNLYIKNQYSFRRIS